MKYHQIGRKKICLKPLDRAYEEVKKLIDWELCYDIDDVIVGNSIIETEEMLGILMAELGRI